ncbi:lipid asymmetry maintenance protein MlaB [Uliginosibacterium sp. sgz301328]|uniref:STAS domain-containing protein n=1 Tax=Uliginosibacterium sp. sgz301328 TaxID=3243764 RepID=UPI00359D5BD5
MNDFTATESGPDTLALAGEVGIYNADAIKQALIAFVSDNETLHIDLSGVSDLDTCGVQLMLLARSEALARARTIRWSGHSQAVLNALETFNLGALFDAPATLLTN